MAFPTVAAQASTVGAGPSITPDISGLGIVNGSLVLVLINYNGSADFSLPATWTGAKFFTSGNMIGAYLWKVCSAGEANPVVAIGGTSGNACRTWQCRFAGHHESTNPAAAGQGFTSIGNPPTPPALNPSWGSGEDTLWLAASLYDDAATAHTAPTNFGEIFDQAATRSIGVATRNLAADSLTPGDFGVSPGNQAHVTITFAVRPTALKEILVPAAAVGSASAPGPAVVIDQPFADFTMTGI